jgi:hypothetical protein
METTIQELEKLNTILMEIPKEVIEMYDIKVDNFMVDKFKLYIKSPVWMSLDARHLNSVDVTPNLVAIKGDTIALMMQRGHKDLQIIVF